jgi:hypothetical protein
MIAGDEAHTLMSIVRCQDFLTRYCFVRWVMTGKGALRPLVSISLHAQRLGRVGSLASYSVVYDVVEGQLVSESAYVVDEKSGSVHVQRDVGGGWVCREWMHDPADLTARELLPVKS